MLLVPAVALLGVVIYRWRNRNIETFSMEEHESRIRRHYDQLLSNLNVPDVVTQMFKSGKLTAKEHEHLRQFHSTPIRASEELLNIIIRNSRDVYECFLESIKKTKQHHVYQMLTSDEASICIDDQSMSEHSRIIRQNYDWLIENLDLESGLLTTLYAKEVLSKREYCHISFEKHQFVKNEELLSIISRRSVDEFENFKIALNETSQGHVTERLAETPAEIGEPTHETEQLELQRLALLDGLPDKYKSDPVLVETIKTKPAKDAKKSIFGLTILDKELFVVSERSSEVEVYDSIKFNFSRGLNLKKLIDPWDIESCNRNKCLYIFDFTGYGQLNEILRIDPNGNLIKKWSTGYDYGWGLSVTDESNVILTVSKKNKLNEYSPDGQLIREIHLSSEEGTHCPWHAIKLTNGNFVISHGDAGDALHRVCIVDADGKLKKSMGGNPGSNIGQLNGPFHLSVDGDGFVLVTDRENHRVLLLDSDLNVMREIPSNEKCEFRRPMRTLLDESNGRMLVADNKWGYDGRILIFKLCL